MTKEVSARLFAIVLGEYNAASFTTVDFYLFYDGAAVSKY